MSYAWKLPRQDRVSLDEYDPDHHGGLSKDDAEPEFEKLGARLGELQELCYAAHQNAVLIVLQGMDASGKDGTIEHVMGRVNPQGCRVVSFKAPTDEERAHDFLWRVHAVTPARGMFAIFNRSHYEDVLAARVRGLVPESLWQGRYDHINAFERLLADSGTVVLKFFLHISQEEQAERLKDRETEPDKRWKLNARDYQERRRWNDYRAAYEDALGRCSTAHAPWYVVPADRKWFRNLAVAEALVDALGAYEDGWRRERHTRGERNYRELLEARGAGG
jgi:PPK2 family polyphosphate:nucleotide phosphotransferase